MNAPENCLQIEELPNISQDDLIEDSSDESGTNSEHDYSDDAKINTKVVDFKAEVKNEPPKRTRKEESEKLKKKKLSDRMGYTKTDFATNRETERNLTRLATRGVVHLFNAVAQRQKFVDKKIGEINNAKTRKKKRQAQSELNTYDFNGKLLNEALLSTTKRKKNPEEEIKTDPEDDDVNNRYVLNTSFKEETTE